MGVYTKIIDLQNLNRAWDKVKSNHPAAGTDRITVEEFEAHRKEYLYQLYMDLKQYKYKPQPVKLVQIQKGEKERMIGLLCMRDKVLQQSIHNELNKIYDGSFSSHTYAYRSGYSALGAISYLEKAIHTSSGMLWVLQLDIKDFFEEISLEKLCDFLKRRIKDTEVIKLLEVCLHAPSVDSYGEIKEKKKGIYQGATCSPICSNIYMDDFDKFMQHKNMPYVRYSDDMIVLGKTKEELEQLKIEMEKFLSTIGLCIKEAKTKLVPLSEGVEFLGYHLDENGRSVPIKAENRLKDKLEEVWFSGNLSLEQKLEKGREILGGWEQYYIEDRKIGDILEYVIVLTEAIRKNNTKQLEFLKENRKNYQNIYKENVSYMAGIWKRENERYLALFEYEQYYQVSDLDEEKFHKAEKNYIDNLIENYEAAWICEDKNYFTEVMQIYADMHCYNKARKISEYMMSLESGQIYREQEDFENKKIEDTLEDKTKEQAGHNQGEKIVLDGKEMTLYMEHFLGREDIYASATVNMNGKYTYEMIKLPFTEQELREHLEGRKTLASYLQRSNHTVKYMVFDLDISKKTLMEIGENETLFHQYMEKVREKTASITAVLKQMGMHGYIEYSGYRGYHVWVFFSEWIAVKYVNLLQDIIIAKAGTKEAEGIVLESFPNKAKIKENQFGQTMKLPWGILYISGNRTYFVNQYFEKIENQKEILQGVSEYGVSELKRIIAANSSEQFYKKTEEKRFELEELGQLPEEVEIVLKNCGLQSYLCMKAKKTGYLTHYERLTILYVFGHLGEIGKEFVHTVMSFTLNYQYAVTERYIHKLPDKPISCIKLREQYKQVTADVGCNCNFKRTKDCYPSPVLHAVKELGTSKGNITIPTAKKVTKEKEQELYEELNIHKKTEELVEKLIELKKQSRGVEKAIKKQEEELGRIFDHAKVDSMELEMGFLMRRKVEDGYEWVIGL